MDSHTYEFNSMAESYLTYPQLDAGLVELVELRAAVEVDADPSKPTQEFESLRKLIHSAA